ncbi:hypothetical protein GQ53DRAFT_878391 [Thozetella sp. PMI_491]|nr:hypothetical protein GQ53DRAFT_878391 [Thozetella sp. PMI_491]
MTMDCHGGGGGMHHSHCLSDAPSCSTQRLSAVMPPTATGPLSSAITSWLMHEAGCSYPCTDAKDPCAITSTLDPALLSTYSAFGSSCASWIRSSSSALGDLADECPMLVGSVPLEMQTALFIAAENAACFGAFAVSTPPGSASTRLPPGLTGSGAAPTATSQASSGSSASNSAPTGALATNLGMRKAEASFSGITLALVVAGLLL